MKSQHCRLICPIVLLLCGVCIVYGDEDTCEFVQNFKCIVNVTKVYGFNIYNPDILDQVPILNKTQFIELCSDYILMVNCLKANSPCDNRGRRYTRYALALAKGLHYACRKDVLEDYDAVVSCFQGTEVQRAYTSCHNTLRTSIQTLVNETVESALTSRIDISVVVEKACQYLISSMDCTANVLHSCSPFVKDWYRKVFTEMIEPTLNDYRCQLYMPVSKIVNLFFVSLAAAIVAGVVVYVCFQRYKSFMRSRMNFVLSVIPKAQKTLRHFDPKRISQGIRSSMHTGEALTTEKNPQTPAPAAAPATSAVAVDTSTVSQPPPIDPATARILQELAKASQQTAPGQRSKETTPTTSTTTPTTSSSFWGWLS